MQNGIISVSVRLLSAVDDTELVDNPNEQALKRDQGNLKLYCWILFFREESYRVSEIKICKSKGLYLGNEALVIPYW